jgi:hypothetical protein
MSDASLLGDFIGSVIEGGEKKKAVRPSSVGEVVHPRMRPQPSCRN